jgi:glycosyltransferase involved in cell wall biosynthesis
MMRKISAVVITLNEERNIARCLASLLKVADEVIVVDSFSADRTAEICNEFKVKFIRNRFEGYIQQKNFAISLALHPVILSLDADEVLSPGLVESILEAKNDWRYDGYFCDRLNNYCGKWIRHTSWYPDRKLRLWEKTRGKWEGLNPHDRVELVPGSTTAPLKGFIEHYSFTSITEHIQQVNIFTDIAARSYYENSINAGMNRIILSPVWKLIRELFFKKGIFGGYYGFVISMILSFETFLKYIKLRDLYRKSSGIDGAIVFFNTSRTWGGGEQWHYQTALKFREIGYTVQVVVNRNSELQKRLSDKNISLKQFSISNWSIFNPFKIFVVYSYLKKVKAAAVILNLSTDAKLGGLAAYLAGVPKIVYRRGQAAPVSNSITNRFFFRKIFTSIIANSQDTKQMILKNNPGLVAREKITVIRNWIEPPGSNQSAGPVYYQKSGNELVLGNLGRLVEVKGQHQLIDLSARLKSEKIDFRMIIGGTGKLEVELKDYARKLNVENEVIFTGFVNDVRSFMQEIDIFILSSYYEGFGFVMAEAMMENRPVIAFEVSSLPELIMQGENGFLVPPGDIDSLKEKVLLLSADRQLREKMGNRGRKFIYENFGFEKQLPLLLELFGIER